MLEASRSSQTRDRVNDEEVLKALLNALGDSASAIQQDRIAKLMRCIGNLVTDNGM